MIANQFDRDSWARTYADRHLQTDTGIRKVIYLPNGAPDREIRLIEVNELLAVREKDPLEPIDFGVDRDSPNEHTVKILDVTPTQWDQVQNQEIPLPSGWSLDGQCVYFRNSR